MRVFDLDNSYLKCIIHIYGYLIYRISVSVIIYYIIYISPYFKKKIGQDLIWYAKSSPIYQKI